MASVIRLKANFPVLSEHFQEHTSALLSLLFEIMNSWKSDNRSDTGGSFPALSLADSPIWECKASAWLCRNQLPPFPLELLILLHYLQLVQLDILRILFILQLNASSKVLTLIYSTRKQFEKKCTFFLIGFFRNSMKPSLVINIEKWRSARLGLRHFFRNGISCLNGTVMERARDGSLIN